MPKTARKASTKGLKRGSAREKPSSAPSASSRKKRKTPEQALHMRVWQWVRKAHPNLLVFHVPNGEKRYRRTAEKLKRMGVRPGVADFLVFTAFRKIAIELKTTSGDQSDAQKRFQSRWEGVGGEYYLCRSEYDFMCTVNTVSPLPFS